ncbi:Hint domain-containing protein [uncultured Roseobacter sp.]|uniref:Hint domain-containing protein n=1 Tax=uncultured Roseobacter sp. TaxID=114847 RepID=UPI00261F0C89|nr:Hint domain-containing protein [uncultured Roseobacter sp.]
MATMNSGLGGACGYGEQSFKTTGVDVSVDNGGGPYDDSAVQVDLTSVFGPDGLNYFGTNYTDVWINSNGLLTFGSHDTAFEPSGITGLDHPAIAAFWSDIDIDKGGDIYWDVDPAAGTITVTWLDVRPFNGDTATNSFQVVLTDQGDGNFDVDFIYEDITWSDGGFGAATAGVTDGGSNDFEVAGSGNDASVLAWDTTDFDGAGPDPAGVFSLNVTGGAPSVFSVDGTDGDDVMGSGFVDLEWDLLSGGDELINSGAGNDYIDGGGGSDTIIGGTGDDTVDASGLTGGVDVTFSSNAAGTITDGADTLDFSEVENLILTGSADSLDAATDRDGINVDAGDGNDTITAGSASDTVLGGAGSDRIFGDHPNTYEVAAFRMGTDFTLNSGTFEGGGAGTTLTINQAGTAFFIDDNGEIGGDTTNETFADSGQRVLVDGVAYEVLYDDRLQYTNDVTGDTYTFAVLDVDLDGSGRSDEHGEDGTYLIQIAGPAVPDGANLTVLDGSLNNNPGPLDLSGFEVGGDDVLSGGLGDDTIFGGLGNDTITGGEGFDSIEGGDGDDYILDGEGNDTVRGGDGNDTIGDPGPGGSGSDDLIFGDAGDDSIYFGNGQDTVDGGDDADYLFGEGSERGKTITGGEGGDDSDTLSWAIESDATDAISVTFNSDEAGAAVIRGQTVTFSEIEFLEGTQVDDTFDAGLSTGGVHVSGEGGDDHIIGGTGDDTFFGGLGGDTISGGDGSDYIDGGDGDDFLTTGLGNDTLIGGAGNDTLMNSDGDDSLVGGTGNDSIIATGGDDTLDGGAGDDTLDGGADNDSITGGAGSDRILTGTGDDYADGGDDADTFVVEDGFGNDTIVGGEGGNDFDVIDLSAVTRPVTVIYTDAETGTITDGTDTISFSQIERIITTDLADVVDASTQGGTTGIDVSTGDGNDTITGGKNADTIDAGTGDDSIEAGAETDSIQAGAGNDTIDGGSHDDTIDGGSGDDSILGGTGDDSLDGGTGSDTIDGGEGHDTIEGGDANDSIIGGDGQDSISGGDGADWIDSGDSHDTISGGDGNDTIFAGVGVDTVDGGEGDDSISGGDGHDDLRGGVGNDFISGGSLNDTIDGGAGNDVIEGGTDRDLITGGDGHDTIDGGADNDTISAGDGNDSVIGGSGSDTIDGGSGNDTLEGGSGNDRLEGGSGTNRLIGGEGADTLDGSDPSGFDIADYSSSASGVNIDLSDGSAESGGDAAGDTLIDIERIDGSGFDDTITADDSGQEIVGGDGNDLVTVGAGDDSVEGNFGDDTVIGGAGDDVVEGNDGDDLLTGGTGDDTFVYLEGEGDDTITDFNFGNSGGLGDGDNTNNDFIDLSNFYDNLSELRADFDDDGFLNQSDGADYSDNARFQSGDRLTFQGANRQSFTADNTGVVCFTSGAAIKTPHGDVLIDDLRVDDLVSTMDNGPQPIRWIGKRYVGAAELARNPRMRPILIKRGVMGVERDLLVSRQHGMLLGDALARAVHLIGHPGIRVANGKRGVTYIHLMFEMHQIIFAESAPSESFYPGSVGLKMMSSAARMELLEMFPELATKGSKPSIAAHYGPVARDFAPKCSCGPAENWPQM